MAAVAGRTESEDAVQATAGFRVEPRNRAVLFAGTEPGENKHRTEPMAAAGRP